MRQASTFPRGGITPRDGAALTAGIPIRNASVPPEVRIPLGPTGGPGAECLVRPGERVGEGMLIARARGPGSMNVHASIPGIVRELSERPLADGSTGRVVVIDLEGEFALTGRPRPPASWRQLTDGELAARIRDLGAMDLSAAPAGLDCLVVDGVEREPYLTCDQRLMIEQAPRIVTGLQILRRLLKPSSIFLGIDIRLVEARDRLERAAAEDGLNWRIAPLEARYPQSDEQLLVQALFGGSTARKPAPKSFVVGVTALHAVYEAVVLGRPVLERVVTVTGLALRRPSNLKVRLGARLGQLVEECGGFAEPPARLVAGGPMTGSAQFDLEAPVSRELSGMLVLSRAETPGASRTPCIGCGRCLDACPWGLAPVELYKAVEHHRLDRWILAGLEQCRECGCCAYVCPAHLPLLAGLRRGRLLAQGT